MILNEDFVVPSIAGRLGNNMFMIANAYARALDSNKQMVALKNQVIYDGYDYSENIFRKIDFIDEYVLTDKITVCAGYFQSENYFKKYSENIKSLFSPTYNFIKQVKEQYSFLFNKTVTAINIRRGDYLYYKNYHPTLSPEYVTEAIKLIPNTEQYLIVSDDMEWCKENLDIPNPIYLEGHPPHEQLWILSLCHNLIISNSSFSWWGAWLSRFENKMVIAPSIWVGPSCTTGWDDIHAKGWTILESRFENGLIYPK